MHSKGNWILRRDCQAKGRSDFYNCHSPYGAANGSLIYLCKSKDLQILEKLSPQGKIVLNSIETGKYTTERKRKFGNGNGFLAGRIYRASTS